MFLQVADLGSAFTAIQSAGTFPEISVLEMIPLSSTAQVLFEGPTDILVKLRKYLPTADLEKSVIIENPHPSVLKAFYHLETSSLDNDLVIIEGDFAGYVLQTLDACLKDGMKLIDFRQPKHSQAMTSVYLSAESVDEDKAKKYISSRIKFRWIPDPNLAVKKFFNL